MEWQCSLLHFGGELVTDVAQAFDAQSHAWGVNANHFEVCLDIQADVVLTGVQFAGLVIDETKITRSERGCGLLRRGASLFFKNGCFFRIQFFSKLIELVLVLTSVVMFLITAIFMIGRSDFLNFNIYCFKFLLMALIILCLFGNEHTVVILDCNTLFMGKMLVCGPLFIQLLVWDF